jgi:hypothetical protein
MPLDSAASRGYVMSMRKPATRQDMLQAEPDQSQAAYKEWLADEIAAGCAELDTGGSVPAGEVWKELGLE